jgi:hypothetical protein
MSREEDEILARELGKLGAIGGAVGGGIGGALGGGMGAGLAARLLPNDTFELDIEIAAKPSDVLRTTYDILCHTGRLTEETEPPSDLPTLCAVVGSGFWNLNPALVRVEIVPFSEDTTKVSVCGIAKEGLIKQHAGEKAAKRIANLLSQAFSLSETRG